VNTSTSAWDNLSIRRDLGTTALAFWILSFKDKTGDDARELVGIPAIDGHFKQMPPFSHTIYSRCESVVRVTVWACIATNLHPSKICSCRHADFTISE
jgi:hypothetical protein